MENESIIYRSNGGSFFCHPKIKNGSIITIGNENGNIILTVDQHFNWFQKKMIKWCFGFEVVNYCEK